MRNLRISVSLSYRLILILLVQFYLLDAYQPIFPFFPVLLFPKMHNSNKNVFPQEICVKLFLTFLCICCTNLHFNCIFVQHCYNGDVIYQIVVTNTQLEHLFMIERTLASKMTFSGTEISGDHTHWSAPVWQDHPCQSYFSCLALCLP